MAWKTGNRVKETTTTTGTGTLALAGAATGYRAFSDVCSNGDVCFYAVSSASGSEWETGVGTWATGNSLARTTIIDSSNAGAAVSFSAGTKDVYITSPSPRFLQFQDDYVTNLPIVAANPSAPAADSLYLYARKISGRVMPKWMPPSGIDNPMQPALFGNRITMFNPNTATSGTGVNPFGSVWTSNGTVTHPTPSSTSPAMSNQMYRTRYANVVTTTNQQLGPRRNLAQDQMYWRGNAAGVGGFFYFSRFVVDLWAAATCRIFSGLTGASATASVVISDTVVNNTCGLWHDTTDSSTTFNFVTRDGTTTTKQAISLSNAIAAGNSYDFYMYAKPNDSTIYWRLDDLVNNVTYEGSTGTTLPTNTVFMQPQCQMSNGTANIVATTVAIGVVAIYVEADH